MTRIALFLALFLALAAPGWAQTANGSITSTTCPGTGCVRLTVSSGVSSVLVQTWGTWVATLTFEGTAKPDGTGYFPLDGYPIPTAPSTTTTTTNGQWGLSVSGLKFVRVRATAYTSGTVLLLIQASSAGRVFSVNTSTAAGGTVGAGDASAANQVIGNDSLASIDSKMGSRTWTLDALSDTVAVVQPEGTNLHIVCDSGCAAGGGGTQAVNITQMGGIAVDALPVTLSSVPTHAVTLASTTITNFPATQPVSLASTTISNFPASQPVTGPLTDTQLRASAVPTSLASVPSHPVTNAGTFAVQVTSAPTTAVTATQLPASLANGGLVTTNVESTRTAGTLTSATCPGTGCVSVVSTNYAVASVTLNGTYSLTPVFEFSDDGTTFYSGTCTRTDSPVQESSGGALVNTLRAWDCSVFGTTSFRVRASAFVSGTGNIGIILSGAPIEVAPTVAAVGSVAKGTQATLGVPTQDLKDSGRAAISLTYTTATPTTADTVVTTLIKATNGVAAAGTTSIVAAASKTLRLTAVNAQIRSTTAALPWAVVALHLSNTTTCTAASSVVIYLAQGGTAAAIGNVGQFNTQFPDGFELPAGGSFCISVSGSVTTNVLTFSAQGFEY